MLNKYYLISIICIGLNFTSFAQNKTVADNGIVQAKLIKFYPNPAYTAISFDFLPGNDNSYSIQIYNFIGKKVFESKTVPSHLTVNLEDFFRGIYIFQLRDKNGVIVESGKFQVIK